MEDRLRILLCEDDENLGMLLREYLQAKGYNADLCADGEAGYKAFLKGKYDLCVLDVMMPHTALDHRESGENPERYRRCKRRGRRHFVLSITGPATVIVFGVTASIIYGVILMLL